MKKAKKILAIILAVVMVCSTMVLFASAKTYSFPKNTTSTILNSISSKYSSELSAEIADLLYDSDYSDFVSDKTTLRNYETNGNKKSWPISNADSYGKSVVDRGEKVEWGWGSAGCMSYACFFTYSVYGTIGTSDEKITLDKGDSSNLKNYLIERAQPGEHIRVSNPHSVIFLDFGTENGKEGFYFCEYWGGASKNNNGKYVFNAKNDQYYVRFISYDDFASKYNENTMYIYNAYESSDFATDTDDDTNANTVSRSIVLVLDISGSMSGSPLKNTKIAAKSFVEQVINGTTNTEIGIVSYSDYAEKECDFTRNIDTLKYSIDSLCDEDMTNMYAGLDLADQMLSESSSVKKSIVLMSDGIPNEGAYSSSGYRNRLDGNGTFYVSSYGAKIYDMCQDYKDNKDYFIYTLGFGLSTGSDAYNLLENICSPGTPSKFVSVTNNNVNDLEFAFDIIDSNITSSKRITMLIECPVDVSIAYAGEALCSIGEAVGTILKASFGTLKVLEDKNGERKLQLDVDYHTDYDIQINGNGTGTMDLLINYTNGDTTTYREFKKIQIEPSTVITTSATDYRADFALYVDMNNDGEIDSAWTAAVNETVTAENKDVLEQLYPTEESDPIADYVNNNVGTISIKYPSRTTIRYKDGIYLHLNEAIPNGKRVEWFASNENFDGRYSADGKRCLLVSEKTGYTTVTARLFDENDNIIAEDSIEMYSKAGFFQKIGGFFRSIFGLTKIYEN